MWQTAHWRQPSSGWPMAGMTLTAAVPPVSWHRTQALLVGMWARPISMSGIEADGAAAAASSWAGWPAGVTLIWS